MGRYSQKHITGPQVFFGHAVALISETKGNVELLLFFIVVVVAIPVFRFEEICQELAGLEVGLNEGPLVGHVYRHARSTNQCWNV